MRIAHSYSTFFSTCPPNQSKTFFTWLHSQNRWQRDSSYSTQKRQLGELTILQILKYLLVGSILWRIRAWNHCNWVSIVVLKHFINIVFQTRPGKYVFHFNVAVGGTSFWSRYSLTLKFPALIASQIVGALSAEKGHLTSNYSTNVSFGTNVP